MTARPSAVFVGCARDCEKHLDGVLSNIANAAALFAETAFVFVENDSIDGTAARLRAFGSGLPRFDLQILTNQLAPDSMRTERLAAARNRYLSVIRQSSMRDFDYLLVYDMDDVNAARQSVDNLLQAIAFLESSPTHAAVFANQLGYYYDVFALRHPSRCPGDAWEEVFDYVCQHRVSDEVAFGATYAKRMFAIDPGTPLIEVDSAFGGLGLYKMKYMLQGHYVGVRPKACMDGTRIRNLLWQACEHVSVNTGIRAQGGRLFIAPWMVNAAFEVANLRPEQICSPSVFRALYRMMD